jgi:hypothetical protein
MNLSKQNQLEKKKLRSTELTRQTHGPGNETEITL